MTSTRPVSPFSLLCLRCCPPARASVLASQMTELVLKKIGKHFGAAPRLEKENDFLVLNNTGRIIGRIVMRACSPKGRPWVWTITAREQAPSFSKNNHGYSESREQAMKEIQAQYSCVEFHRLVSLCSGTQRAVQVRAIENVAENHKFQSASGNASHRDATF